MPSLTINCLVRGKKTVFLSVKNSPVKGGIECYFVKLTNGYGMKIFTSRFRTIASMNRQKRAAENNIGPKVIGGLIRVVSIEDGGVEWEINRCRKCRSGWAYLTQIANTNNTEDISGDRLDKLEDRLIKIGLKIHDLHSSNLGFIGKRLVVVDFGNVSCG